MGVGGAVGGGGQRDVMCSWNNGMTSSRARMVRRDSEWKVKGWLK